MPALSFRLCLCTCFFIDAGLQPLQPSQARLPHGESDLALAGLFLIQAYGYNPGSYLIPFAQGFIRLLAHKPRVLFIIRYILIGDLADMQKDIKGPYREKSSKFHYLHYLAFDDLLHLRLEDKGIKIDFVVNGPIPGQDVTLSNIICSEHGHDGPQ